MTPIDAESRLERLERLERARAAVEAVVDPEIPVITIADLGVLRGVELLEDGTVEVKITPTYSGCPAVDVIGSDIDTRLRAAGFDRIRVRTVLAPAWSTDEITPAGRAALTAYGIVPPGPAGPRTGPVAVTIGVHCPRCGSLQTEQTSRFGATACKALWRCRACAEPFELFKSL